jgi:flagellar biosynthesis protein FlhG
MSWGPAQRLLDLAARRAELRPLAASPRATEPAHAVGEVRHERPEPRAAPRARSLCIASGKGGTGKTVVGASVAALFAARGRTLVLDADMGVGNAHILHNVLPERTLVDVVEGSASLRDIVCPCAANLDLAAAGSGVSRMCELSPFEGYRIARGLAELERDYAFVLVDSAAGVSTQTVTLAAASDLTLLVTTPDLTALTDAYAFFKVLLARRPGAAVQLLVNRAPGEAEAHAAAERIENVARRFLGRAPERAGWIPEDPELGHSANQRRPVVSGAPASTSARALRQLAARLAEALAAVEPAGVGHSLLEMSSVRPLPGTPQKA